MALGGFDPGRGGSGTWLGQRVSGLVVLAYCVWLLMQIELHSPLSHHDWLQLFAGTGRQVAFLLFLLALCWHAWLGVKSVLMDYVPLLGLRLMLLSLAGIALLSYMLWAAILLFGVPAS